MSNPLHSLEDFPEEEELPIPEHLQPPELRAEIPIYAPEGLASASASAPDIARLLHIADVQQKTIDSLSQRHDQAANLLDDLAEPLRALLSEAAETTKVMQDVIADVDEKLSRLEDAVAAQIDLRDEMEQMLAEMREMHKPQQHVHRAS